MNTEIDSAGNMHLRFNLPTPVFDTPLNDIDPTKLPTSYELFVLGDSAYQPDDQNPGWMAAPVDASYRQSLSSELHCPDSPAMWLSLLPEGSITPAGKESVGGFAVDKYSVAGTLDGQKITGSYWKEPQADALVQAELYIPAALLSPADQPQAGEMKIVFHAQNAAVPTVVLRPVPAGLPTATPAFDLTPTANQAN